MKSVVYGAGAIGSILGATLRNAGHEVVLVARPKHVIAIREHGLEVKGVEEFTIEIDATTEPDCVEEADIVFLTVKTQDTKQAVEEFSSHLGKSTPVVSLQNGIRNPEFISEIIGKERVIPGVVRFTASYLQPGVIEYTRTGPCIIGRFDGEKTSRMKKICEYMSSGIMTEVSTNIEGDMWAKLVLNLINLPMTLTGLGFPRGLKNRYFQQCLIATWEEGHNVVKESGIKPTYRILDQLIRVLKDDSLFEAWFDQERNSIETYPSTLQSLIRGSSDESEYLTGEIIRLGEEIGLVTPVNSLLMRKFQGMTETGIIEYIPAEKLWGSIAEVLSS
ncbi:MAG: ketopantoate reductase family protein, partial [Candidatus Thorarchaeota archaeon]